MVAEHRYVPEPAAEPSVAVIDSGMSAADEKALTAILTDMEGFIRGCQVGFDNYEDLSEVIDDANERFGWIC